MRTPVRKTRCAIYTRKSSEEGFEMEFNSLDAQREAALAYIQSQRHEGWIVVGDRYDDGGFSGGTMERPALQRLLRDVQSGVIDVIVVYKVDRLSRSLRLRKNCGSIRKKQSLVRQHNAAVQHDDVYGPAHAEHSALVRPVRAGGDRRAHGKFAASRRKGLWMGGIPPLGYDVVDRKLVVNEKEAELVRLIFARFLRLGSATKLAQELRRGWAYDEIMDDAGR